jgi:hypothetical protein
MQYTRRNFIKTLGLTAIVVLSPIKTFSTAVYASVRDFSKQALRKLVDLIDELKRESSNIVIKTLNGKKYRNDSSTHYPLEDSIEDEQTQCQVFFHAHRKNEYGHFHTFTKNSQGELVHLIMISMDKKGRPISLSTINQWVTGDVYVNSDDIKKLFLEFKMDHNLFPDKRIIEFIEHIFKGYENIIMELFEERDAFVNSYNSEYQTDPFEDYDWEVLSFRKIDIYQDLLRS